MLNRLRQLLVLTSLALLGGLLYLWASGDLLIVTGGRYADARSHVFVRHASLHVDCTGAYYILRDLGTALSVSVGIGDEDDVSDDLSHAIDGSGPLSFGLRERLQRSMPLQDLTDSAGRPILMTQSVPLRLITVPAWLTAALLALAPAGSLARRIRRPRRLLTPLAWCRRRAVAMTAVASMLVCGMWILSQYRYVRWYEHSDNFRAQSWVHSRGGALSFHEGGFGWTDKPPGHAGLYMDGFSWRNGSGQRSGLPVIAPLQWSASDGRRAARVAMPYWLLFVATATVPLTWLAMRLWGWRARDGHCRHCGYDLRASPGRCPECGRAVDEKANASVGPQRAQRVRFATAALLFMLSAVVIAAWVQSGAKPCDLLDLRRDPRHTGLHLAIDGGAVLLFEAGKSTPVLPTWVGVFTLMAATGYLFWSARRMGVDTSFGPA